MSTREILETLLEQPFERMKVVYWACQGLERKDVSAKINISLSNYDYHIGLLFKELDYLDALQGESATPDTKRVLDVVHKPVNELFEPYEITEKTDFEKLWKQVKKETYAKLEEEKRRKEEESRKEEERRRAEEARKKEEERRREEERKREEERRRREELERQLREEEERRRIEEKKPKEKKEIKPPPDRRRPQIEIPRWVSFAIAIVIISIICVCLVNQVFPVLDFYRALFFPAPQDEPLPTSDVETRLTQTYEALVVVDIFEPTETSTPSPKPLTSPSPTRTPLPLPFIDEIERELREEWIVLGDDTLISEGSLHTFGTTWLFLGNEGWTDYLLEIAVEDLKGHDDSEVAVRVNDFNNMFIFGLDRHYWYLVEDGLKTRLTEDGLMYLRADGTPNYRYEGLMVGAGGSGVRYLFILVKGSYIDAYVPSLPAYGGNSAGLDISIPQKVQDKFRAGGIGIKLDGPIKLHYVKVHPAP